MDNDKVNRTSYRGPVGGKNDGAWVTFLKKLNNDTVANIRRWWDTLSPNERQDIIDRVKTARTMLLLVTVLDIPELMVDEEKAP